MIVLKNFLTLAGTVLIVLLLLQFQHRWIGKEFTATTFLKLNRKKAAAVFSLTFFASLFIMVGTFFSATDRPEMLRLSFDIGLFLWLAFFVQLNRFAGGGLLWEPG